MLAHKSQQQCLLLDCRWPLKCQSSTYVVDTTDNSQSDILSKQVFTIELEFITQLIIFIFLMSNVEPKQVV